MIRVPDSTVDAGLQRLTSAELFPPVGVPLHVNRPRHEGNVPLHDHDFLEIALVIAGWAVHRTIHGQQTIGVGDCFVIHPGQWHAYEQCRHLEIYNCCFGVELLSGELAWTRCDPLLSGLLPDRLPQPGLPLPSSAQGILAVHLEADAITGLVEGFERLRALQERGAAVGDRASRIGHLLLILGVIAHHRQGPAPIGGAADPAVGLAARSLEERLDHPWTLDQLAEVVGLNRSYLVRLFKRHIGLPPLSWLSRRRAEKAAVLLLTTTLPVAEVGRRVGWTDANYFARRFRAAFAMTASDYRAQLPCPALVRPGRPGPGEAGDWIQW